MRSFLFLTLFLAPLSVHAVVATKSQTAPTPVDTTWTGVGQMNGGSAVAIGEHLVLTAGHIAAGDFLLGGSTYHMTSTESAPKVGKNTVDLRVVHVSESLSSWYSLSTHASTGDSVTMVGYGNTGVVNAAASGYSLERVAGRHAGTDQISSRTTKSGIGPSLLAMLDTAGDAALAGGDSGGGWFVNGQLAGISSFVFSNDQSKPDYGFSKSAYFGSGAVDLTNTTLHNWLVGVALRSRLQDRTMGAGTTVRTQPVPEPSALLGLGLGAATFVRRRSQRK